MTRVDIGRASSRHFRRDVLATRTALLLFVLLAWEIIPRVGLIDRLSLVPISDATIEAARLIINGDVLPDLASTASLIGISFVIASVSGLIVGFMLWQAPGLYRLLSPYLTSYYALPIVVFYPALIAIFGLSSLPVIIIASAWAVVAVVISTVTGLDSIPRVYHKVAAVYRVPAYRRMTKVYVPAAAPLVFNGLRLAASYSIIGVMAAEFVLAPGDGLGYLVKYSYNNFQVLRLYAVVLIIIVLAMTVTTLVYRVERALVGRR